MRILAINDISCVGRCSLTVALPILNACGHTCDVLPTALLSTHTGGFSHYSFLDLTLELPKILKQWKELGLQYDIIYSGYLGNISQIEIVKQIKKEFLAPNGKLIVDPVLGDNGKLYQNFNMEYVSKMRTLCAIADYILPNHTEAILLTYSSATDGATLVRELQSLCPNPIVTGVNEGTRTAVYYRDGVFETPHIPGFFCGAGDVFASVFTACLADHSSQQQAIADAARFTYRAVQRTQKTLIDHRYGLNFEQELSDFAAVRQSRLIDAVQHAAIVYLEHDAARIQHLVKVRAYAERIADEEYLPFEDKKILSLSAVLHDIGIHNAEKKFGNCSGKNQEKEGPPVARALLQDFSLSSEEVEAVCYMIAHHHSYASIGDNLVLRILVEADMLVNAYEEHIPLESLALFKQNVFRTQSGKKLLQEIYGV